MKAQGRRRTREGTIHNVKSSYSMAILIILQCHTLKHHQPHITCREKGHKLHHKASSYLVLFSKFIYILPAIGMPFANNNDLKQVCFDVKEQQKLSVPSVHSFSSIHLIHFATVEMAFSPNYLFSKFH